MTDPEFAAFVNIPLEDVPKVPPAQRAAYEAMAPTVEAVMLYDAGLGPIPPGVIVTPARKRRGR